MFRSSSCNCTQTAITINAEKQSELPKRDDECEMPKFTKFAVPPRPGRDYNIR